MAHFTFFKRTRTQLYKRGRWGGGIWCFVGGGVEFEVTGYATEACVVHGVQISCSCSSDAPALITSFSTTRIPSAEFRRSPLRSAVSCRRRLATDDPPPRRLANTRRNKMWPVRNVFSTGSLPQKRARSYNCFSIKSVHYFILPPLSTLYFLLFVTLLYSLVFQLPRNFLAFHSNQKYQHFLS